ncbi:MAG TPA: 4-hydroxy-tetrahydrodipicolinate reductase, partial [Methanocorpusculum sp.]|nr:4-hydroxy-tetrahydrodipicolinate reductase [Methanocorpusculum sp.]
HTVQFHQNYETIELTHRAYDRAVFARGAVRAAAWVPGKAPGLYTMKEVLGL